MDAASFVPIALAPVLWVRWVACERRACMRAGEIPARPHQGWRQGWQPWRPGEREPRQGEGSRQRRHRLLEALPEVPLQEVLEEAAAARLAPCDCLNEDRLRVALLQYPRAGRRRG